MIADKNNSLDGSLQLRDQLSKQLTQKLLNFSKYFPNLLTKRFPKLLTVAGLLFSTYPICPAI